MEEEKRKRREKKKSQIRVACALICDTYAVREKRWRGEGGKAGPPFRRRTYEENVQRERERESEWVSGIKAAGGGRNKRVVLAVVPPSKEPRRAPLCRSFVMFRRYFRFRRGKCRYFWRLPSPFPPRRTAPSREPAPSHEFVLFAVVAVRRSSSSYLNARCKCAKIART